MLENMNLSSLQQLKAFSDELRLQIVFLLVDKPMTGSQLARLLNLPRQKVHYHLNILLEAGLITVAGESLVKGLREIYYRSSARNFSSSVSLTDDALQNMLVHDTRVRMYDAILNMVHNDLLSSFDKDPEFAPDCAHDSAKLTIEQIKEINNDLLKIDNKFLEFDRLNQEQSESELHNMRLTFFHIPVRTLHADEVAEDTETDNL